MDTKESSAPHAHPFTDDHDHQRPTRLYACAGCSSGFPRRELTALTEDNHDNLTYFHGDRLCPACADNAGVEY